jgi:hypothetical protein
MPLRIAFPIFLTNTLEWLSAAPSVSSDGITRAGEIVALTAPDRTGSIRVQRPDGKSDTISVSAPRTTGAPVLYDRTDRVGVYRAAGSGGYTQTFAVSLLSSAESRIAPTTNPQVAVTDAPETGTAKTLGGNAGSAGNRVTVRREVWPYAAALVLVILCMEWLFFHRRSGH